VGLLEEDAPLEREIDVVYTWVDGAWPGYPEQLQKYARKGQDLNPNRYRDNLEIIKYSVRSLVEHVPFLRHLYIVATRPQMPSWLDTDAEGLSVVYHDEFFEPEDLPTFNSFAIVANLYRIAGVSRRFLYMEDDRLFGRRTELSDFVAPDGKLKICEKWAATDDAGGHRDESKSPWEAALAYSNHLLNERYGRRRRGSLHHNPLLIDKESFARFAASWPEAMRRTSASRFRSMYNIAPEHMYPHYLLHEGEARSVSKWRAYRDASYLGVENFSPIDFFGLWSLRLRRPKWYSLNDNFDERPNPRVVRMVKRFLERAYPTPSRFERR